MASKYDGFWHERLTDLSAALGKAATGEVSQLDVSEIQTLGHRTSWHGSARVRDGVLLAGNMAHAVSLGRQLLQSGALSAWPQTEFLLSIDDNGRLTVRVQPSTSRPAPPGPLAPQVEASPPRARNSGRLDPSEACRRIHLAVESLPGYDKPAEVMFNNGLYFFYEQGEASEHGEVGRVVRIGNHPRSVDRLVERLEDHYRTSRNAKNGSVFRRYLGGALMRQRDPTSECLAPVPGQGHWEHQHGHECPRCVPVEREVTSYLTRRMSFRCIQIDDITLRNHLEEALIATVSQCRVCEPSDDWLGKCAYPGRVRRTGLWNVQHTEGSAIAEADLHHFESLAEASTTPVRRSMWDGEDLSDRLLVIPCSGGKKGASALDLPVRRVADYLDPAGASLLEEARELAFARPGVQLDRRSPLRPAIEMYSGQPFATPHFRSLLADALAQGLHCLIVSGGYGILRPEELVHQYGAYLPTQTRSVWTQPIAELLRAYVTRNAIQVAFIAVSRSYASCLPRGVAPNEWWGIPQFDRLHDHGSAMRVVPAKVGQMVVELLRHGLKPGAEWRPSPDA